jgi:hypothetical protein
LQRSDPKTLSNEELAGLCTTSAVETASGTLGCLASIVVILVLLLGPRAFGRAVLPGVALLAGTLLFVHFVVRRWKRRYRKELNYRRGMAPLPQYIAEAEAVLRQHAADWVLLFSVSYLPHGGFRWLRMALHEGPPPSAHANLRTSASGRPVFECTDRDVPEDIVREVLSVLKALDLDALTDVPPRVIDGAPCRLTVLRRAPWLVTSASCNLGGFPRSARELAQFPAVLASLKLNEIIHRLGAAPFDER